VLQAADISVTYRHARGRLPALDGASCAIRAGSVTAIVGPNGAGKSTLLRVLAGVRRPDAGRVLLDAEPLGRLTARERARRIALVAQQPSVAFDFDARRVIGFGAEGAGRPRAAAHEAIERFGLGDIAGQGFGSLSVGQRQRVSMARAWAQLRGGADHDRPGVLLADEPVSAMDPAFAVRALGAARDLADAGCAVALVLHDLSIAARVADFAVLLETGGRVRAEGPADRVLTAAELTDLFGTPIVRANLPGVGPTLTTGAPAGGPGERDAAASPSAPHRRGATVS
jgi:iron complex transport system ATP-binding protein